MPAINITRDKLGVIHQKTVENNDDDGIIKVDSNDGSDTVEVKTTEGITVTPILNGKRLVVGEQLEGLGDTPTPFNLTIAAAFQLLASKWIEEAKSAYQSYLDTTTDNPTLSESDWVTSLYGTDGAAGPQGIPGADGVDGEKGEKGDQGIRGLPGDSNPVGIEASHFYKWVDPPDDHESIDWENFILGDGEYFISNGYLYFSKYSYSRADFEFGSLHETSFLFRYAGYADDMKITTLSDSKICEYGVADIEEENVFRFIVGQPYQYQNVNDLIGKDISICNTKENGYGDYRTRREYIEATGTETIPTVGHKLNNVWDEIYFMGMATKDDTLDIDIWQWITEAPSNSTLTLVFGKRPGNGTAWTGTMSGISLLLSAYEEDGDIKETILVSSVNGQQYLDAGFTEIADASMTTDTQIKITKYTGFINISY